MIPLATTTIRVESAGTADAYERPTFSTVASGIRAHIGGPGGAELLQGGSREAVVFRLDCDPVELRATYEIVDEQTSERFAVIWAKQRKGLGLDHTVADLRQVVGVASG